MTINISNWRYYNNGHYREVWINKSRTLVCKSLIRPRCDSSFNAFEFRTAFKLKGIERHLPVKIPDVRLDYSKVHGQVIVMPLIEGQVVWSDYTRALGSEITEEAYRRLGEEIYIDAHWRNFIQDSNDDIWLIDFS